MSFRYKFILSFVFLELVFVILIVLLNFSAIKDSSNKLTQQKMDSNIEFLQELLKVPLSIYDLATLDNLIQKAQKLDYINSVVVLDNENKIISEVYDFKHLTLNEVLKLKNSKTLQIKDEIFEIKYQKIFEDDFLIGSFYIIFDKSSNSLFIKNNEQKTLLIVLIEILISMFLAFFLGRNLTKVLEKLAFVSQEIGEARKVKIPFLNKNDEIGTLAKAMEKMQDDLINRKEKLNSFTNVLQKQKAELLKANKAKDEFLANMSHELKTPLNSINLISSIMIKNKEEKLDFEQIKNLKIINNCGKDLLELINAVLDISKLEAKKLELFNETVDFYRSILDIKDMFTIQVKQKGLDFIFEYDKSIKYIYTDKRKVNQILKNLLSNAVKFTNSGSIKFLVENSNNDEVKITIQDSGIGISNNKKEDIFDRFKQADSSTTRKYGGTGLGLAISKELTKLLNARLVLESSIENKGAKFVLYLPKNSSNLDFEYINLHEKINKEKQENKKEILILNENPVLLFSSIVELKKSFTIKSYEDFQRLYDEVLKNKKAVVLINIKNELMQEYEDKILALENRVILININKHFSNKNIICINKNEFSKENLISELKKS